MSENGLFPPELLSKLEGIEEVSKKMMWNMVQYKELQMAYDCAMREVKTKLEVLNAEFDLKHSRNPIASIHTRLKSVASVIEKLKKYGVPMTLQSVEEFVNDFAGVRIICSYIDDVYSIANAFLSQDDVTLITVKDYIKEPKENGYRSLHLIVSIPVFFSDSKRDVKVEVQIRTVAMDFWASLEHEIRYKSGGENPWIYEELRECAKTVWQADEQMLSIRERVDAEKSGEESELSRRLRAIAKKM